MSTKVSALRFTSQPYQRRIALIPMSIGIIAGWTMVAVGVLAAIIALRYYPLYGSLVAVAVGGLVAFMGFLTFSWVRDRRMSYELKIDADALTLVSYDTKRDHRIIDHVQLSQITYAEYYPAGDVSALLLRTEMKEIDIPLWSFGPEAEREILIQLQMKGVDINEPTPYVVI